jgi:hypothetical protein
MSSSSVKQGKVDIGGSVDVGWMPLGNIGHSQWDKVGLTSVRCRSGVRGVLGCSKMTLQWGSTCRRSWDSRFSVVWLKAEQVVV